MIHDKAKWMNLSFHMAYEQILRRIHLKVTPINNFGILFDKIAKIPYHLIYGIICGYKMRDILKFIESAHKTVCPKRVYQAILPTVQFYQDGGEMGKELGRYMKKYPIRKIIIEVGKPVIAEVIEL